MNLKPVEIFYSQDSINNTFDRRSQHSSTFIGETLDQICERRCSISNIPTISVAKVDGRWVTADNRRLWVFRQLYRLNKCDTVPVHVIDSIPPRKMTSNNKGVSILVRGGPGGRWHIKQSLRSSIITIPISDPSTQSDDETSDDDDNEDFFDERDNSDNHSFSDFGNYHLDYLDDEDGYSDIDSFNEFGDYHLDYLDDGSDYSYNVSDVDYDSYDDYI